MTDDPPNEASDVSTIGTVRLAGETALGATAISCLLFGILQLSHVLGF